MRMYYSFTRITSNVANSKKPVLAQFFWLYKTKLYETRQGKASSFVIQTRPDACSLVLDVTVNINVNCNECIMTLPWQSWNQKFRIHADTWIIGICVSPRQVSIWSTCAQFKINCIQGLHHWKQWTIMPEQNIRKINSVAVYLASLMIFHNNMH